jgi:hypothetical protein
MPTWNGTNPVIVGNATQKSDYDRLFDNVLVLKSEVSDLGIVQRAQSFRGLSLRTHPDADKAASQIALTRLDEAVMSDGARYAGLTLPLTADITASGAGGLDTGGRSASTLYEVHLIGKSSTKAVSDLRLLLHRSKNYKNDQSQTTVTSSDDLRHGATDRVKLAQGIKVATVGLIEFVDLPLVRVGTPTGRFWLEVQSDTAGNPSGTVLATSDKLDVANFPTSDAYVRFVFRNPFAAAVIGTQYHLVLNGDYSVSATDLLRWDGNPASSYANGSAKKFDGTTWAAAAPADFAFKLYVTDNNTALTLPGGYDQSLLLGRTYNDGANVLLQFVQIDRLVRYSPVRVGAIVTAGAATFPLLVDAPAPYLPPVPCEPLFIFDSTTGDAWTLSGIPDGYAGAVGANPYVTAVGSGSAGIAGSPFGGVLTEYQGFYYYRSGGANAATIYIVGYCW